MQRQARRERPLGFYNERQLQQRQQQPAIQHPPRARARARESPHLKAFFRETQAGIIKKLKGRSRRKYCNITVTEAVVRHLKSIGVTHRYQNSDIFGNLITQIEFAGNGWSHAEDFQVKINNARRQRGRGRLNGVVMDFDIKEPPSVKVKFIKTNLVAPTQEQLQLVNEYEQQVAAGAYAIDF